MVTETRKPDPTTALIGRVRQKNRAVIDHEMQRLARRAPALNERELGIIANTLDELVESLFIARMHTVTDQVDRLARLLDTTSDRL